MAKNEILGDAKGTVNVGGSGKDNYIVTHILPVAKPDIKSGAKFVAVGSVEQVGLRLNIPHKHYDIIIRGTHNAFRLLNYIPTHTITQVLEDDWEYIKQRYGKHPSLANGRIFAENTMAETVARAENSETQELAQNTGTAQITDKKLAKSDTIGEAFGVSDVTVKNAKS